MVSTNLENPGEPEKSMEKDLNLENLWKKSRLPETFFKT